MNENKNVNALPEKASLQKIYESYEPLFNAILEKVEQKLKGIIKLSSLPTYKSRIKSFPSYYKKILRQKPNESAQNDHLVTLTDMIGIRVICAFLEDLEEVEKQIASVFRVKEIERKGADQTFKEFGYESVHILIELPKDCLPENYGADGILLPENTVCEIQIRTILQDAWAEVERELAYRRNSFYEKADHFPAEELGTAPVEELSPPVESGEYTRKTIDDLVLEALHAHNIGKLD